MEELSIKEYLQTIYKRKFFIIAFTIACALLSILVTYKFITPRYSAELTAKYFPVNIKEPMYARENVVINPAPGAITPRSEIINLTIDQIDFPDLSLEEIVRIMNSAAYKEVVLKNTGISPKAIDLTAILTETRLITIQVAYISEEKTKTALKAYLDVLPGYLQSMITTKVNRALSDVNQKMNSESAKLKSLSPMLENTGAANVKELSGSYAYTKDLLDEFDITKCTIDSYKLMLKELRLVLDKDYTSKLSLNYEIVDSTIRQVSPNVKKNVIAATVLGLLFSLLVIVFREYGKRISL